MIYQYAQTLKATIAANSTIDDEGNIISVPERTVEFKIRYLPNRSAKSVKTSDGESIIFSGTCYAEKGLGLDLSNGDMVSVPGFIDFAVPIIQIHRAQFRTRFILK